jgi:predicted ATPase
MSARNTLQQTFHKMLDGHAGVCFVSGEAGTGKTTLLNHFAWWCRQSTTPVVVVQTACFQISQNSQPFEPFWQALSHLTNPDSTALAQIRATDRRRALAATARQLIKDTGMDAIDLAAALASAIPFVGAIPPLIRIARKAKQGFSKSTAPSWQKPAMEPRVVSQMFINYLSGITDNVPLVILIDDLEWADAATVDLLLQFVKRSDPRCLLIVSAFRALDVSLTDHPLQAALPEIARVCGTLPIDLTQAAAAESHTFIEAVLRQKGAPSTQLVNQIHHQCGGNPLHVVELLAMLIDAKTLTVNDGHWQTAADIEWTNLPVKVSEVIGKRIQLLTDEMREALELASAAGESFLGEVLEGAHQRRRARTGVARDILQQLNRAKQLSLIDKSVTFDLGDQILTSYHFLQRAMREMMYAITFEPLRKELHLDIALTLEAFTKHDPDALLPELAWHFEKAGRPDLAARYSLAVAEHCIAMGQFAQSVHLFEEVLTHATTLSEEERATALLHQASALTHLSQQQKARPMLAEAIELARTFSQPGLLSRCYSELSWGAHKDGDGARALEHAMTAIAFAKHSADNTALALAHRRAGSAARMQMNYPTADAHFEKAAELYGSKPDPDVFGVAACYNNRGNIAGDLGDWATAVTHYTMGLNLLRRQPKYRQRPQIEAATLGNLGEIQRRQKRFDDARVSLDAATELAQRIGDVDLELTNRNNRANVLEDQGDLDTAAAEYAALLPRFLQHNLRAQALETVIYIGRVRAKRGGEDNLHDAALRLAAVERHQAADATVLEAAESLRQLLLESGVSEEKLRFLSIEADGLDPLKL